MIYTRVSAQKSNTKFAVAHTCVSVRWIVYVRVDEMQCCMIAKQNHFSHASDKFAVVLNQIPIVLAMVCIGCVHISSFSACIWHFNLLIALCEITKFECWFKV